MVLFRTEGPGLRGQTGHLSRQGHNSYGPSDLHLRATFPLCTRSVMTSARTQISRGILYSDTSDHSRQIRAKKQLIVIPFTFAVIDIPDQKLSITTRSETGYRFLKPNRRAVEFLRYPQSSGICAMKSRGRDLTRPNLEVRPSHEGTLCLRTGGRLVTECLHQFISVHSHPFRLRGSNHDPPPILISGASTTLKSRCSSSNQLPSSSVS